MLIHNKSIHWMPGHVGEKRFANWLADAKDWNISRNRFWGSCIPVWINEDDPSDMICKFDQKLKNYQMKKLLIYINTILMRLKYINGNTYKRTPEV